jgi:formate dehydrogenase major subunit
VSDLTSEEFPMVLTTGRQLEHWHTGAMPRRAIVLDAIEPEAVVFIPFCYAEASANILNNPALDPFGKIPEFKFCAARVEILEVA